MIFRSEELIVNGINGKLLLSCIEEHQKGVPRLDRLENYYKGKHDILNRTTTGVWSPNNKLVCNFAKYITDTAVGYAFGNPVTYTSDETDITELLQSYKKADINTHDSELAKDLSVFGIGYELAYMTNDASPMPKTGLIDPRNAFVVYDDTVLQKPLFGICYFKRQGGKADENIYSITVYTETDELHYHAKHLTDEPVFVKSVPHYFGGVPLTEYFNNEEEMGDFEHVISLIDAYNILQSDRVNDKEKFVDSVLLIRGCQIDNEESAAKMLTGRILELPYENADAKYLTKTLNESETEILKAAIAADIHKFSQTPDFTDERFSGNASGVALKYKLLSLENLAKVKERFFISGLKERMKLFAAIMAVKGKAAFDTDKVNIVFNRALPTNEFETAQMVATLNGIVPVETLLTQLTFVKDAKAEAKKVIAEKMQPQGGFGDYPQAVSAYAGQ